MRASSAAHHRVLPIIGGKADRFQPQDAEAEEEEEEEEEEAAERAERAGHQCSFSHLTISPRGGDHP
jgi:hypothetical protein